MLSNGISRLFMTALRNVSVTANTLKVFNRSFVGPTFAIQSNQFNAYALKKKATKSKVKSIKKKSVDVSKPEQLEKLEKEEEKVDSIEEPVKEEHKDPPKIRKLKDKLTPRDAALLENASLRTIERVVSKKTNTEEPKTEKEDLEKKLTRKQMEEVKEKLKKILEERKKLEEEEEKEGIYVPRKSPILQLAHEYGINARSIVKIVKSKYVPSEKDKERIERKDKKIEQEQRMRKASKRRDKFSARDGNRSEIPSDSWKNRKREFEQGDRPTDRRSSYNNQERSNSNSYYNERRGPRRAQGRTPQRKGDGEDNRIFKSENNDRFDRSHGDSSRDRFSSRPSRYGNNRSDKPFNRYNSGESRGRNDEKYNSSFKKFDNSRSRGGNQRDNSRPKRGYEESEDRLAMDYKIDENQNRKRDL
jgi:hypothetical protein